jgi:hypothetical protein
MKSDSTPIRVGRFVVGHVRGDTFYKRLRASAHFLRVPPAIAFDVSTLDDAERAGARFVHVTDGESGRVYRSSIATIRANGFRVARGFGEQIALALDDFTRDDEPLATQLNFLERAA